MTISVTSLAGTSNTVGATVTFTPSGSVPAGALIFVAVDEHATTIGGSFSDSVNSGYSATTGAFNNNTVASGFGRLFYFPNCGATTGGATVFTYTKQGAGLAAAFSMAYATGIATSSPLDTAVTATATGTGTSPSVPSNAASVSGELFVAFTSWLQASGATLAQDTTHNWATPPILETTLAAAVSGGNQVNAGTSAITYAPILSAGHDWTAQVYGFKPAGVAAFKPAWAVGRNAVFPHGVAS